MVIVPWLLTGAHPAKQCGVSFFRILLRARSLPAITDDALAGVAAGGVGQLAVEGGARRPAAAPDRFGGEGGQRGVGGRLRAVDDEGRAGQRQERGLDVAVGVVVMRPVFFSWYCDHR